MDTQSPQSASRAYSHAQSPASNPVDKTFEEKSWKHAFRNTVFSQYCPPKSERRDPPSFTVCDFHGPSPDCQRKKEVFQGDGCEDQVRTFLEEVQYFETTSVK
jgi:hypothetical protein